VKLLNTLRISDNGHKPRQPPGFGLAFAQYNRHHTGGIIADCTGVNE